MKPCLRLFLLSAVLCGAPLLTTPASAQSTGFTYQGRLTDNASAATGNYDLRFTLYSVATGGSGIASPNTINPVAVTAGLFTVSLDFGTNFPGADRWLEIAVRPSGTAVAYTVLTPRQKFTSVPYALHAASAATSAALTGNISAAQITSGTLPATVIGDGSLTSAKLGPNSVGSTQLASASVSTGEMAANAITSDKLALNIGVWNKSGNTINYTTGGVGIGTANPQGGLLDVEGDIRLNDKELHLRAGTDGSHGLGYYGGSKVFGAASPDGPVLYGFSGGGLGVANPDDTMIVAWDWQGNVSVGNTEQAGRLNVNTGVGQLSIRNDSNLVPAIEATGGGLPGIVRFRNSLEIWPNTAGTAAGRIDVRNTTGGSTIVLDGQTGDASVKTLTITGGSDIAEPFQMSGEVIPEGSVVIIDEENAGRLKLSDRAYDSRVAGIVSGAKGINPGLSLHQAGVIEGGQNVALTGRVHAMADATAVPIKPGDLLTTSDIPGHVMTATDRDRAHGTILGKAMSSLKEGKGWVLVLVNLQ